MTKIIELAHMLGEEIAKSEEIKNLERAKQMYETDAELQSNGYTVTDLKKASLGADFEIESSKGVYSSQDGIIRVVERVVVSQIEAGGAAYSAGLRVGDEILSITVGDTKTEITRSFMPGDILLGAVIGDTVTLEYLRDGNTCTAVITISADMISVY